MFKRVVLQMLTVSWVKDLATDIRSPKIPIFKVREILRPILHAGSLLNANLQELSNIIFKEKTNGGFDAVKFYVASNF